MREIQIRIFERFASDRSSSIILVSYLRSEDEFKPIQDGNHLAVDEMPFPCCWHLGGHILHLCADEQVLGQKPQQSDSQLVTLGHVDHARFDCVQ